MKVLVTGATGFLGTALVERLLARGEKDIRCFLRSGSDRGRLDDLARRYPDAQLELYVGSLASKDSAARALDGVSVVYHLAASLLGAAADIFLNTVVASKHLLEAIAAASGAGGHPIKVVLVSSFGVYGVAGLPRGHVVDEATPLEAAPRAPRPLLPGQAAPGEALPRVPGPHRLPPGGAAPRGHLRAARLAHLGARRPRADGRLPLPRRRQPACRSPTSTTAPRPSPSPARAPRPRGRPTTSSTTTCPPASSTSRATARRSNPCAPCASPTP